VLKYLIAVVLIAASWLTWWLVEGIPLWAPIAVSVVAVLAVVGVIVYARMQSAKAARELENALAQQASHQMESARPDLQAELDEVRAEFEKAVSALKGSKLGRGRRDALYILPWYLIIGPPGSGKTTALRNSGLEFPHLRGGNRGVRGIGGTRNCDWWLTNEAVLLDTAGRWSTQEEDHDEWLGFLGMLRKYRKRKPLNGIIVTLSVVELAEASSEELTEIAKRMRERIDEAMAELRMALPIYVLFTKCDLMSGFVDTFGSLSKDERNVVWGFTVPLKEGDDAGATFEARFEELTRSLEGFCVGRLDQERRLDKRHKIFSLPQQLEELRRCFTDFINQLFAENVFSDTPMMRGAYFASGTQEGRPFDLILQRLAGAYNLSALAEQEHEVDPKGYFLNDLFRKVMFPDRDLALRSEAERKRQKRVYYAAVASVLLLAGFLLTLPTLSWFGNRALINRVADRGETLVKKVKKARGDMLGPKAYTPLVKELAKLEELEEEGAPLKMRAGLYQGDDLIAPTTALLATALRSNVVRPLFEAETAHLDDFGRAYESRPNDIPTGAEYLENLDRLRFHLLLTAPKHKDEPALTEDNISDSLAAEIADRWAVGRQLQGEDDEDSRYAADDDSDSEDTDDSDSRRHRDDDSDDHEDSEDSDDSDDSDDRRHRDDDSDDHEDSEDTDDSDSEDTDDDEDSDPKVSRAEMASLVYVDAFIGDDSLGFRRDADGVKLARSGLSRVSGVDLVLDGLVRRLQRSGPEIAVRRVVGSGVPSIRGRRVVRPAFTKRVWEDEVRGLFEGDEEGLLGDMWVLGEYATRTATDTDVDEKTYRKQLRSSYFERYIDEWREFIRGIQVDPPTETTAALGTLQDLTRGRPTPLGRLFLEINRNVDLREKKSALEEGVEGAAGKVAKRALNKAGKRAGLRAGDIAASSTGGKDSEQLGEDELYGTFRDFVRFGVPDAPEDEGAAPQSTALDVYQEQLLFLRNALQSKLDDPSSSSLSQDLAVARAEVTGLINEQDVGWRPAFSAILWPPIEGASMSYSHAVASVAGRAWCNAVSAPFRAAIRGRFPLRERAEDVPLADFAAFYAPDNGTVWKFYDEFLKRRIQRRGDNFEFATGLGMPASQVHTQSLRRFLNRSWEITQALFPSGSAEPRVDFDIRIRPAPTVAEQIFSVGGRSIRYYNGPEQWTRMTWPGDSPTEGASIEIRGAGGMREVITREDGWGLFRLIEEGNAKRVDGRTFTVLWRLRSHDVDVMIDFRMARRTSPFFTGGSGQVLGLFRSPDVTAPSEIVTGRRLCGG
jgi:type VI protein secretion system component VasK